MKTLAAFIVMFLAIILVFITGAYLATFHTPLTRVLFTVLTIAIVCTADWLINKLMWSQS